MKRLIAALFVMLALASPAGAQGRFQDTALLDRAVAGFTGRPIGVEGGARAAVDARLRLAACPTVSLSWRSDAHDAVVIACPAPEWRIFVPVVAAPPSARPATPTPAGPAPKAEIVIRRGDPVTVIANANGFSVTRDGIAMGDAAVGQRFMVGIEDGKRSIQAVAVAPGQAALPGFAP